MPSIEFENFVAVDQKSSPTDLRKEIAQTITNLSTTKKPGALVKDGAYSDVSSSLLGAAFPSSITFKALAEWGIVNPANTDLFLLHATADDYSDEDQVHIGQSDDDTDLSALPATGSRELTEHEGPYTLIAADITAGTDADAIVVDDDNTDFDDLSTTNDYYNDWFMVVSIAANETTEVIVLDYAVTATTKTFTVKTGALTGIAASDSFSLARSRVYSDGIGETSAGAPPRYGSLTVDDIIRWRARENAIIGLTGNQSAFPTQFNLWVGYIARNLGGSDLGDAESIADFYFDNAQMQKPNVGSSSGDLTAAPAGNPTIGVLDTEVGSPAGSLTTGSWSVYVAYEYDDLQIGPLSDAQTITVGSGEFINYTIRLGWTSAYDSTDLTGKLVNYDAYVQAYADNEETPFGSKWLISRRITAVRVYFTIPGSTDIQYLTRHEVSYLDSTRSSKTGGGNIDSHFALSAAGVLKVTYFLVLESSLSSTTYSDDVGQTDLRPNFKYGTAISSHFLGAGIRTETGERKNNNLIASVVDGAGATEPDRFGASNILNLGIYGSRQITGVTVLGDENATQSPKAKAIILTDDDYYVFDITPGSSFSFKLDNIGQQEGLIAPDSLVYAEGFLLGVSRNGFRVYTPGGVRIIGEGFKDAFDALTTPSEGIGQYFKKERVVVFHFPTDSKTFVVDMLSRDFRMFEYSWADTFVGFAKKRNGDLLAIDATKVYQIGSGSDQDGTAITPTVKTKKFTSLDAGGPRGQEMNFVEGFVSYKSDTAVTLNFYLNGSGTAITWNNSTMLPAQSSEDDVRFLFPKGTRAYEAEAELTLNSTQASTNTVFQVNRLRFDSYLKRRF